MRVAWCVAAAALLAVTAGAARRSDQDFEFDDDVEAAAGGHPRRPRRYIYDPNNSLCRTLECKKREVCVLRDAFTALCANKKDILRRGDILVAATASDSSAGQAGAEPGRDDDDDVFYDGEAGAESRARTEPEPEPEPHDAAARDRCVGCAWGARAQFLCGSDNRTYSSLCRLDLHNCVRRPARPVTLACRGFCPCTATPAAAAAGPRRRRPTRPARLHKPRRYDEYDEEWWRRNAHAHNDVLPPARAAAPAADSAASHDRARPKRRRLNKGSTGCALEQLADRLLDWFSVLMDEASAAAPAPVTAPPAEGAGFPRGCKPEVRWMFAHLDTDGDGLLSNDNLYSLRHDEREQCLRPFLSSCVGADGAVGAGGVTRGAWCACLRRAARPCTALARAHSNPNPGAYVPACDARGFYRARQCHPALGVCWCVTPHGVERPGSRTKGAPACPVEKPVTNRIDETELEAEAEAEAEGGAPSDDEDAGGSGDAEMRF